MKNLPMRIIKFLFIATTFFLLQALSAQDIEKYYVNIPDALNPTLTKQNRLELLEYHKAKQSDSIINRFGNTAYLLSLDTISELVVVKNTASSTFEMKVLNLDDSTRVIAIIRTICGPICQSTVEFYDTAWNSTPLQFIIPKAIDWLNEPTENIKNIDNKWVNNILEDSFISLSFDKQQQIIIAKNNSLEFLSDDDRKLIAPYISDKFISYKLIGRKWVLL